MSQQIQTVRVGSPEFSLGPREALTSVGAQSGDEAGRGRRLIWSATGRWRVGTQAPDAGTQFAVIRRVVVTNGSWTLASRTITKTGAFANLGEDTEPHERTYIPSTTDGGWTVGVEYEIESKLSSDQIVLAAGPSFPADASTIDGSAGIPVDTTNDQISYVDHHFVNGEPVVFAGGDRPEVASPYGAGGGAGDIRNDAQFYVKVVDRDTIEIHGSRSLAAKVDFTSQGANWDMRRYPYHYVEERLAGNSGYQAYNTIGAPTESNADRYPSDEKYADTGFDVDPVAFAYGGELSGEIVGMCRQCAHESRTLHFVVDPDPDVRADGLTGELLGTATVVGATDIWTLTAHGLLNGDVVHTNQDHNTSPPISNALNYYVRRIDANTFYLCTDEALTTILNVGSDGTTNLCKSAAGSKWRAHFKFTVPNTVSNVASFAVTDATWDDGTLILADTGAFANYIPRPATLPHDDSTGDVYEPTSTDGGWTSGERVTVFAKADDDSVELLDDGFATLPATHAGEADGTLYQIDYVPFRLSWKFTKDIGDLGLATGSDTGSWEATLRIGPSLWTGDPGTTSNYYEATQRISKTFPRRGTNYSEARRFDWGPCSKARYYPAGALPAFTYAADEEIEGQTSGAFGIVIDHDPRRQTITYRPKSLGNDLIPGETITGSSGSMVLEGPIERGPLPVRVCQRLATGGANDGRTEFIAQASRAWIETWFPS